MKKVYSKKQLTRVGRFLSEQCFIRESKKALFLILCVLISSYSFAQDAFTVTWPLTSDGTAAVTGDGSVDVTANDVYVGSTYENREFDNGLIIAEGKSNPTTSEVGYWIGRGGSSYPNSNFTGPRVQTNYENYETTDMYVEFSIQAAEDKDLKITQISIPLAVAVLGTGTPGGLHCSMAYSLDGFSGNEGSVDYILGTSSSAPSAADATGTFNYDQDIIVPKGGSLAVRFIVWRRNAAGIGNTGNKVGLKIGSNVSISGTSHEEPLPVKLSYFNGKLQGSHVELNWTTASEKNNSHFDVLRSANGNTFNKIDQVQGVGSSDITNTYSYTDKFPYKGDNYYKLRQVDFNGKSEESQVIIVKALSDSKEIKVYQQDNTVSVQVYATIAGSGILTITDISGKVISNRIVDLTAGNNQLDTDLGAAAKGVYLVKVLSAGITISAKFIR